MTKKIKEVEETEEQKKNRENVEAIAKNIYNLAGSVKSLLNGSLKRKTIIVLLAHSSGQTQTNVSKILDALEKLDEDWLN